MSKVIINLSVFYSQTFPTEIPELLFYPQQHRRKKKKQNKMLKIFTMVFILID